MRPPFVTAPDGSILDADGQLVIPRDVVELLNRCVPQGLETIGDYCGLLRPDGKIACWELVAIKELPRDETKRVKFTSE